MIVWTEKYPYCQKKTCLLHINPKCKSGHDHTKMNLTNRFWSGPNEQNRLTVALVRNPAEVTPQVLFSKSGYNSSAFLKDRLRKDKMQGAERRSRGVGEEGVIASFIHS